MNNLNPQSNISKLSLGRTINTGGYQSLRVDVEVERLPDENDQELLLRASNSLLLTISNIEDDNLLHLRSSSLDRLKDYVTELREHISAFENEMNALNGYTSTIEDAVSDLKYAENGIKHGREAIESYVKQIFDEYSHLEDNKEFQAFKKRTIKTLGWPEQQEKTT